MKMNRLTLIVTALFVLAFPVSASASEHRFGLSMGSSIPEATNDYEAGFFDYSKPIFAPFTLGESIVAEPRLTATFGMIGNDNEENEASVMGSLGPDLILSGGLDGRWFAQVGIHPTLMNNYEDKGMGGFYQFTSHFGVGRKIGQSGSALLRIQHSSNASIWSDNRGLDLITLAFRYEL